MCRFRLQRPRDKSDSDGGASPAAPGDHLRGLRVTRPRPGEWGLGFPQPRSCGGWNRGLQEKANLVLFLE